MNTLQDRTFAQDIQELGARLMMLNPAEAGELAAYLRDVYGIAPPRVPDIDRGENPPPPTPTPTPETFAVVLEGVIDQAARVSVMKTLRQALTLSLQQAREVIDNPPRQLADNLYRQEAEQLCKTIQDAGGRVAIR